MLTRARKLLAISAITACLAAAPALAEADTPQERYDDAFAALLRGDNTTARSGFEAFLRLHPRHDLAAEASHWLGELALARRDNASAASAFSTTVRRFPDSERAAESYFRLGVAQARMGERAAACRTFARFTGAYPDASASLAQRVSNEAARTGCGGR